MTDVTTYIGIDAHKQDLFIARFVGREAQPVEWKIVNEPNAVRRLRRQLERDTAGPVHIFYEAGPCGYRCSVSCRHRGCSVTSWRRR